jgi:UDP-3-O-[3-hydroxymyristoyl] glucosamine N-acyltransferase
MSSVTFTLEALAKKLGLTFYGEPTTLIKGLAPLVNAGSTDLSFYHNERYFRQLQQSKAAAIILKQEYLTHSPAPVLIASNPYAAFAKATQLFAQEKSLADPGIHPSAVIAASAEIADGVRIAAGVVIGEGVKLGANTIIGPNSVLLANVLVGEKCIIGPNNTLYEGVQLGNRVHTFGSVVIGSDGFGFARDGDVQVKIVQLGSVQIGNDVEIGACSTIDRGALDDTIIGNGVKIDNQVQIAHNVVIGENSVICGCSAIAGSSVIGKNCIIAGAVGVINHITICDNVTVTAMSLVNHSITKSGTYSSGTPLEETTSWRKNMMRFKQLDSIWRKLLKLEKQKL